MEWKYAWLEQEFDKLDNRIRFIAYALEGYVRCEFKKELMATEILRDEETQREYYPDDPDKVSVHQFWRGIDFRSHDFTEDEINKIVEFLNSNVYYGKDGVVVCIYHDVKGIHLHVQVGHEDKVRLKKIPTNI